MAEIHAPPQPGSPKQARRLLPLGTFGTYLLLGALFCMLAAGAFSWLARGIFADHFVQLDDGLITLLHSYWNPFDDQVMFFFTMLGDPAVLAPLVIFIGGTLWYKGRWIDAMGLVLSTGGAGILNQILKSIFQRARPDLFQGPLHLTNYSFPSGHSMGSIACYGMLAFIGIRLLERPWSRWALGIAAALIVLCVGISRVYFGVHYPTDVLGGYLIGSMWLSLSIMILQATEWQMRRRTHTAPATSERPAT